MYERYVKRGIDFILALIILPFVLFVIVIMTPFILISDPGPIFYSGLRRGRNGMPFKMYKFRSMEVQSKESEKKAPIGRFMRKTSIDEIPQFLNVLIGGKSFVGPRPTLATKSFEEVEVERRKRYDVKPGITGYAQAYFRNSISQEDKFKYDLYYVDHVSFKLDLKILSQTMISVIKRENIYVKKKNNDNR